MADERPADPALSGPDLAESVDIELLGEYAEGLLDGTAQAQRVADRLTSDPRWQVAYESLPAATATVRTQLANLGNELAGGTSARSRCRRTYWPALRPRSPSNPPRISRQISRRSRSPTKASPPPG